jgi:hypothetical protein
MTSSVGRIAWIPCKSDEVADTVSILVHDRLFGQRRVIFTLRNLKTSEKWRSQRTVHRVYGPSRGANILLKWHSP